MRKKKKSKFSRREFIFKELSAVEGVVDYEEAVFSYLWIAPAMNSFEDVRGFVIERIDVNWLIVTFFSEPRQFHCLPI